MRTINHILRRTSLLSVSILVFLIGICGQTRDRSSAVKGESPFSSPFRYVIVHDDSQVEVDENDGENQRYVEVLLDDKAFTERNLRILFSLLSKRFADPQKLYVDVYTSLDQAPTPEERDGGTSSGKAETNSPKLSYWAIYVRTADDEYFRYSPVRDKRGNKLVQIKPAR